METNQNGNGLLRAAEYMARVLPGGQLELPAKIRYQLQLRPNMQVKVILLRAVESEAEQAQREAEQAQKRHAAIADLLALRQEFAGMNFDLTEAVVRMRELEDG
jgi:MOSC domain-containing protein YiiM